MQQFPMRGSRNFLCQGGGGEWGVRTPCPPSPSLFVRISDEYAANILRTAMFTVIVRYIFTSCREYPANKVFSYKKVIAECLQFVI